MTARRYRLTTAAVLLAGTVVLGGCSVLGISRVDEGSPATSGAADTSASSSPSPSSSPGAPFGQDATAPDDGVGSLSFGEVDRWLLANEDDNIHAEYLSMPGSPQLAVAQQGKVSSWASEYRAFVEAAQAAQEEMDAPAADEDPASPTPQTEAGTQERTGTPTGSASSAASRTSATESDAGGGSPTSTATGRAPGGSGPQEMSLRVVPQLLSDGRLVGVRLYARLSDGTQVREHVRTFWAEGAEAVPGQVLFADVGQVRRLVLAEPEGAAAGSLSDAELFAAAAFSTEGDLVVYLPSPESDQRLVVGAASVSPLLSDLGREAQEAAREATVSDQPTATSGESDGESAQMPDTSVTTSN